MEKWEQQTSCETDLLVLIPQSKKKKNYILQLHYAKKNTRSHIPLLTASFLS